MSNLPKNQIFQSGMLREENINANVQHGFEAASVV
jgi:hypothetical protein